MPERLTFNVIFTPGTVARLVPFALSLRRGSGMRLRLVANACHSEELALLRDVAGSDRGTEVHVLATTYPLDHGTVLNVLFEAFPEPHFAFADSDVLATGDFLAEMWPLKPGYAAVSAAPAVWRDDLVRTATVESTFLTEDRLPDGTTLGSTHLAIYDREATERAWRRSPAGFEIQRRHAFPPEVRQALSERGWDYAMADTCRIVNLQLLFGGWKLASPPVLNAQHIGGVSLSATQSPGTRRRRVARILRHGDSRVRRLAEGLARDRLFTRLRREPERRENFARRSIVLGHLDETLEALHSGTAIPPMPSTGSAEVDERLEMLTAAMAEHYIPIEARRYEP